MTVRLRKRCCTFTLGAGFARNTIVWLYAGLGRTAILTPGRSARAISFSESNAARTTTWRW